MLANYHFHSICSFDCEVPLADMCREAASAGVKHLCLTDHCDLVDEFGKVCDDFSWESEDIQLTESRSAFPELDIRRGVELGEAVLRPEAAEKVLSEPGIDFVLGSMHNTMEGIDFYNIHNPTMDEAKRMIEEYLGALLTLSRTNYFDVLSHLTYPLRYLRVREGLDITFSPWDDLVQEILKTCIQRGKGIELNTSGYRNNGGVPLPGADILRRYRELGGELITIGSDAHEVPHFSFGLQQGEELLKTCGFRYLTLYRDRKPEQIKLV